MRRGHHVAGADGGAVRIAGDQHASIPAEFTHGALDHLLDHLKLDF